jgi:hypothetical protein
VPLPIIARVKVVSTGRTVSGMKQNAKDTVHQILFASLINVVD